MNSNYKQQKKNTQQCMQKIYHVFFFKFSIVWSNQFNIFFSINKINKIKPKVKRLNKVIHPNSRKALQLASKEHRKQRTLRWKFILLALNSYLNLKTWKHELLNKFEGVKMRQNTRKRFYWKNSPGFGTKSNREKICPKKKKRSQMTSSVVKNHLAFKKSDL